MPHSTLPGFLAACGGGDDETGTAPTTQAAAELADRLRFSNWQLYIDIDEKTKKRPTLEQFTEETGVKVDYFEDINDNASYFGKIQRPLSQGQSIDRDIIVLTDNSRFPSLLISKDWAEKLDKSAIPNITNLQNSLAHPSFDPDREYSLPWQSGMTGIATNTKLTGGKPVLTIDELLESPELKGKVTMLTEMADTVAVVMLANGDDPTKVDDASFTRAVDRIKKAVDSGQIRQFTGNDYTGPLAKGDLAAALSWSGDVVQLTLDNHEPRVEPARDGRHDLDRQHADPEGRRRLHGLDVHELRLPAGDRRADRGVHQLRLAGGGREGGDGEARPGPRGEPARSSRPTTRSRKVSIFDSKALSNNEDYNEQVAGADRQLTACASCTAIEGLVPYLLLAPGLAWLAVFFVVPLGFLALPVAAERLVRRSATSFTGASATTGTRSTDLPRAVAPLAALRRAGDGDRARRQLPARLLDRLPRRPLEEPLPARRSSRRSSSRT